MYPKHLVSLIISSEKVGQNFAFQSRLESDATTKYFK